jgi:hypothetical protein
MKKAESKSKDDMRAEYNRADLGPLVRGKYASKLAAGSTMVLLEPDVAKVFSTDQAVNDALRGLIKSGGGPATGVRRVEKPTAGGSK